MRPSRSTPTISRASSNHTGPLASHTPEGTPPHFAIYIAVADADATVAKARELGGSVEMEPEDTPYGRLAVLADTTGSRLSIMGETT